MNKFLQTISKAVLPCAIMVSALNYAQSTFEQDFSSSTTVSDYVQSPATPTPDKFDGITTSGAQFTWDASGNNLKGTRGTANAGSITRIKALATAPDAMSVVFDLSTSSAAATTTAAIFYIGNSLTTANSNPANANVNSRIGINLTATNGTFALRDIGGGTNSANLSGVQKITWVINKTGSDISYTAPDGNTETVANGKADVWAGTTKIFDEMAATTASVALNDFKFIFTAGTGSITVDNIVIKPLTHTTLATINTTKENISVYGNNGEIIVSSDEEISSVKVYDFSGRLLSSSNVNAKSTAVSTKEKMVIVNVTLANGKVISKKVRL